MKIKETQKSPEIVKKFYETMMLSYTKHTLSFKEFQNEVEKENVHLLTISHENKIIATCSFFVEKIDLNNNPYYGSIHRITVNPRFRGQGLGIKINEIALDFGKQLGCKYVYCSAVINIKGSKENNVPNLGQLNICLNKLGYVLVGFRLVDLPDFDNIKDKQFTSTAVLWKSLETIKNNKNYNFAKRSLFRAYNRLDNSSLIVNKKRIYPFLISNKKTGARLGSINSIESFVGTTFLPSYFLPFYGKNYETIYFALKYGTILTNAYINSSNITGVDYDLMENIILDKKWVALLKKIQNRIIQTSNIKYTV